MYNNPVEVIKERTRDGITVIVDANLIQYKDFHPYKVYNLKSGVAKLDFIESSNSDGNMLFDENDEMELDNLYEEFLRYLRTFGRNKPKSIDTYEATQIVFTNNWIFTLNLN